jgi:hypothetical protein
MSSVFDGIKEGNVVRLKLKNLFNSSDLLRLKNIVGNYCIGSNVLLFAARGGDFLVSEVDTLTKTISITNTLDESDCTLIEEMIESIEVIEPTYKFISQDAVMSLMYINGSICINGQTLAKECAEAFLKVAEQILADKAIENCFT